MTTIQKNKVKGGADEYKDAERISTREFLRNYNKYRTISQKTGKTFVTTNQNVDELIIKAIPKKTEKKYTLKDLLSLRFSSGEKNMSDSREIDRIVYGL